MKLVLGCSKDGKRGPDVAHRPPSTRDWHCSRAAAGCHGLCWDHYSKEFEVTFTSLGSIFMQRSFSVLEQKMKDFGV